MTPIEQAAIIVGIIVGFASFIGVVVVALQFVSDRPTRKEVDEKIAVTQAQNDSLWKLIKDDLDYIRERLDKMN